MKLSDLKTADAVHAFGGKKKLADSIGYTRQAVYDWGTYLPPKVAMLVRMAADDRGIVLSGRRKRAA